MKLPKSYDLYKYNDYVDNLKALAIKLADEEYFTLYGIKELIHNNKVLLKKMSAIITHLELAIDEVLKVPGVNNEC